MTQAGRNPDSLPTSGDPSGPCLQCGRTSNFTVVRTWPMPTLQSSAPPPRGGPPVSRDVEVVTVLQCQGCERQSVVVEAEIGNQYGLKPVMFWPSDHLADLQQFAASIPQDVLEAYSEGSRCLAVESPNAAAAMFRTVLAQIIQDKGSTAAKAKRTLKEAITQMEQHGTMWSEFGDWANHIEHRERRGARRGIRSSDHGSSHRVRRTFHSREIINFLYVQPAMRAAARAATRRAAPQPGGGTAATGPATGSGQA